MTGIASRDNANIKEYLHLRASAAVRKKNGRFVLEGARLVGDALESGAALEKAFFTQQALEKHAAIAGALAAAGTQLFTITPPVAEKLADTGSPQGIFCTAAMPRGLSRERVAQGGDYLACETVQDPGNMGTILRTAEALGAGGVLLSQTCVDVFSPKVVRASMGAVFRLPVLEAADFCEFLRALARQGFTTIAAVPSPDAESILSLRCGKNIVAVIGNEGAGLTPECEAACTVRAHIPMRGRAESLNAAAAASILLWELLKGRE